MRLHITKKEDIRSEAFMKELFGLETKALRQLAERENWNVSKITRNTWLYDMYDAKRMFDKYLAK